MYQLDQLFTPPSEDFKQEVLIEDLSWQRDVYLNVLVDSLVNKVQVLLQDRNAKNN